MWLILHSGTIYLGPTLPNHVFFQLHPLDCLLLLNNSFFSNQTKIKKCPSKMPCGCRLEHKELEQMEPILNPKTGNFTAYTVLRFGAS